MIPRIGVASSVITIVTGQIIVGSVLDHFGMLGASVRVFDPTRLLGIAVMMVGVWITVK
jgi:transporter family-2 protein